MLVNKMLPAKIAAKLAAAMPVISTIAAAVGVSAAIIVAMIIAAEDKLTSTLNTLPSDSWYIFNWRVDMRQWYFGMSEPQQFILHLYTPLASILTF